MTGLARPEILATTDWLAEQLGRPGLRVLDLRWRPDGHAPAVHAVGHIPGAVLIDWRADLSEESPDGDAIVLANPEQIAAVAERAGISDGTTVVVYDDSQSVFAARAWWSLRAYGLESVRILDGGYPVWVGEGRPISNAEVKPMPSGFTVRGPNRTRLTTPGRPRPAGRARMLPCSTPGRRPNTRGSRATRNASATSRARSTFRSGQPASPAASSCATATSSAHLLHAGNVSRGRRMVCYDGSGVAAAKLAFVLTLLGHDDVAVYDGGWAEWGNRYDLPVDR